jgi:UDPglucose--hexose-1-phosphate uridylyltransferase
MPPEVIFDPLGRRHVLLAPERARRGAPRVDHFEPDPAPCDFCGGREDRTPPETFSIREPSTPPDAPGWSVRVVPNLYPATTLHEVVIHTPDHDVHFESQDLEHRTAVLSAYRARLRDTTPAAAIIVWNRGRAAGASRTHGHGQIFGLDFPPPTLERETRAFGEDPCVLCTMAREPDLAISDAGGYRIVAHRVPFVADELLLVPPCTPRFEDLSDADLARSSDLLADALTRFCGTFGAGVPFNLVVHTAPRDAPRFHWHAHLMPRTAIWGGLEMGAELPIVASDPYETARRLRES